MKHLKIFLKILIGLLITYWLFQKGNIKSEHLTKAFSNPALIIGSVSLISFNYVLGAWRWSKILTLHQNKPIKLTESISLTWIGALFSTVLPGAITGDLFKLKLASKRKMSKKFILFSILFDRVVGVSGLIALSVLVTISNYASLNNSQIKKLFYFNITLFLLVAFFFVAILFFSNFSKKILNFLLLKFPFLASSVGVFFELFLIKREDRKSIYKLLLVSIFSHILVISAFQVVIWAIEPGLNISFHQIIQIAPLGFLSIAIPISPAGLGVGHLAFENLFALYGIKNGASLFNVYWLALVFTNILGVIPFIFNSHKNIEVT